MSQPAFEKYNPTVEEMNNMAAPRRAGVAPPTPAGIAFGDLNMYVAGGGLPEDDYIWSDLTVQMHDGFGEKKSAPRLGVMITMKSLTDEKAEDRQQFYSFGSKAHLSFAPNPETGKGMVAIPGGVGTTMNNSTNWAMLLKSLYDSGLPVGIFVDDVSVLEGIHVHMLQVPEPAERAGYASKTGEAAMDGNQGPKTIAVVSEIKEDGKPWEGSGGDVAPKPARPAATKRATTVVAASKDATEELNTAATNAVAEVLGSKPNGCAKLILKTSTFKAVSAASGLEVARAVQEAYFTNDDDLNGLLGPLGYKVAGTNVTAA